MILIKRRSINANHKQRASAAEAEEFDERLRTNMAMGKRARAYDRPVLLFGQVD